MSFSLTRLAFLYNCWLTLGSDGGGLEVLDEPGVTRPEHRLCDVHVQSGILDRRAHLLISHCPLCVCLTVFKLLVKIANMYMSYKW